MAWKNDKIKESVERALAPIGVEYRLNEEKSSISIRLPSKAFNAMEFVFLIYEENIVAKFLTYREVEAKVMADTFILISMLSIKEIASIYLDADRSVTAEYVSSKICDDTSDAVARFCVVRVFNMLKYEKAFNLVFNGCNATTAFEMCKDD